MTHEINIKGRFSKEPAYNSAIYAKLAERISPSHENSKKSFLGAQEINLNNKILNSLPQFDLVRLIPHLDYVYLPAGKVLYQLNETVEHIYFPETAVASNISDLEDGSTIETSMVGNEGATGVSALLGTEPAFQRSQITIKGAAWKIKTEILRQELVKPGKLQALIFDYVNYHMNHILQRLICKSFHVIEQRFCSWLLMLQDRAKTEQLPVTHENTALLLGSQRPSITMVAQILRKKGLIDYSRGGIFIQDRRKMENAACECYSVFQNKLLNN
jgi:CRP-like cAMP-binding protein